MAIEPYSNHMPVPLKQQIIIFITTNELTVVGSGVGITSHDNDELNRRVEISYRLRKRTASD